MKYTVILDEINGTGEVQLLSVEGNLLLGDTIPDILSATKESIEAQAQSLESRWLDGQANIAAENLQQEQIKDAIRVKIISLKTEFVGVKDVPVK